MAEVSSSSSGSGEEEELKSEAKNVKEAKEINITHQTIFYPYKAKSDTKLYKESALLAAQLGNNGSMKLIRDHESFMKELKAKIDQFLG
jgi:hypothetical protein